MNRTKTLKYIHAVEWIAFNDEPTIMDTEAMADLNSVCVIADCAEIPRIEVARDVIRVRREAEAEASRIRERAEKGLL